MPERSRVPFSGDRLQREILVAPLKREPVRSDGFSKYGKTSASSFNNIFTRSAGYNIKNVIAGLEKRRAELIALALEAMAKAQEARDRCVRAENRLQQETNQRLVAEQRIKEFEEDRMRQMRAGKIEGGKTIKAELEQEEVEARLKEAECRIKTAENDARSLTLALARADQKRAEAEATARAAKEKAHKIESLYLGAEAATPEARERNLVFGLLVYENKKHKMRGMEGARRNESEKRREQKSGRKNFAQKHHARLSSMPGQSAFAEGAFRSASSPISVDYEHTASVIEEKELGINSKFIFGSVLITLALVGVFWLI